MKLSEKIFSAFMAIALILKFMNIPGASVLLIFSMFFLSIIYYPFGFAFLNGIRFRDMFKKASYKGLSTKRIVFAIGAGIAMSAACVGITFRFQHWPGGNPELIISCIPLAATVVICLLRRNGELFYKRMLVRSCIWLLLGATMLAIPGVTLLRLQYRNYPAYLKAREAHMKDPDNRELYENEQMEYYRMTLDSASFKAQEEGLRRSLKWGH